MTFRCQDISDLGKLCRLCLSQENTLIPIYFQFSGTSDITFASKINETLGLETSSDDCLPQNICQPCCQMIDKWHSFKLACQLLDSTLRRCATKLRAKKGRKLLKVVPEGKSSEFTIFVAEETIDEDNQKVSVGHVSRDSNHSPSKDHPKVGFGGLDSSALSREEMIKHFSCKFCGKFFSRYNNRIKHENQYHKARNNSDQEEVVSEVMKDLPYACSFCPRKFSRLDNLKTHKMRVHSKVRPFFCECGSGFVRKQDLVWHQNTHVKNEGKDISEVHSEGENTPGKSLECSICDATFSKTEKLNEHIEHSHIESQYQCSLCQCKFLSLEELLWHQKKPGEGSTVSIPLHSSNTSLSCFMCSICNQSFVNIGMTKSHLLRVHGLSKNSSCCQQPNEDESASLQEQCETFSNGDKDASLYSKSSSVMDEHSYFIQQKREEDTPEQQIFFCSQCGKEYRTLGKVIAHEKLHGTEAFDCKDCGKSFNSALRLRTHSTIHTDIKPYSCSLCNFTFRLATNLAVHMKRHSSDPHFICTTCGKEFLSVGGLKRHELLHAGVKKYPCQVCGKLFFTEPERRRHMKYHSGDKTYSCPYCDKKFYEQGHLSKHVMSHSEHFEFSCNICSLSFSSHKRKARHDNSQVHLKKLKELQSEAASDAWILNNIECDVSEGEANVYNDLEASENDFTCNDSQDYFEN